MYTQLFVPSRSPRSSRVKRAVQEVACEVRMGFIIVSATRSLRGHTGPREEARDSCCVCVRALLLLACVCVRCVSSATYRALARGVRRELCVLCVRVSQALPRHGVRPSRCVPVWSGFS